MSADIVIPLRIAVLLSLVGGFLDAYSYLNRGGVFAGAQSGNIVLVAVAATQGAWAQAAKHVPSILAFGAGVIAAELLHRPWLARLKIDAAIGALVLEAAALVAIGFAPPTVPNAVMTAIISFICAVQLASFSSVSHWSFNSTMTTGNLRTAAQSAVRALLDHDAESRTKALDFASVIGGFAAGAGLGALATAGLHDRAVWVAAAVLCVVLLLFVNATRAQR